MLLLGSGGHMGILLCEYAHYASGDFVVDDSLVVLADNVYAEFLERWVRAAGGARRGVPTTMSSLLSSKGSLSMPS